MFGLVLTMSEINCLGQGHQYNIHSDDVPWRMPASIIVIARFFTLAFTVRRC